MLIGDLPCVYDGGLWEKLKEEVEAETTNESDKLDLLTKKVMVGFISSCARKSMEEKNLLKKRGFKNCPATYEGEKEEACLINKEKKMIVKNKGFKRCVGSSGEYEEDEDHLLSKKKKQKRNNGDEKKKTNHRQKTSLSVFPSLEPPAVADMPEAFKICIEKLGGTQIKLVLLKTIHETDLSKSHNRLSMSVKQLKNKFLSEEEEEKVFKDNGGMEVVLVEPCLEVSKVHLTKWLIGGSQAFVFKTRWHQIVINNPNTLKKNAVIQIWSFRIIDVDRSQLGFALIPAEDDKIANHH